MKSYCTSLIVCLIQMVWPLLGQTQTQTQTLQLRLATAQDCRGTLPRNEEIKQLLPALKQIDWPGMTVAAYKEDLIKYKRFEPGCPGCISSEKNPPEWFDFNGDGLCDAIVYDWLPPERGNYNWVPYSFYFLNTGKGFKQLVNQGGQGDRKGIVVIYANNEKRPYFVSPLDRFGVRPMIARWSPELDDFTYVYFGKFKNSNKEECSLTVARNKTDRTSQELCAVYAQVEAYARPHVKVVPEWWRQTPPPDE